MAAFLVVRLDSIRIAFPASVVDKVFHAVAVTPLPGAPGCVLGVVDVHGRIVPVLDLRGRFGLAPRGMALTDHLVMVRTEERYIAVHVDGSEGVVERDPDTLTDPASVLPGIRHFAGISSDDTGVLFVYDIEAFLSLEEARALDRALEAADDS